MDRERVVVAGLGEKRLAAFSKGQRYNNRKTRAQPLGQLRSAPSGRAGELETRRRRSIVTRLVAMLQVLVEQIAALELGITEALDAHPHGEIIRRHAGAREVLRPAEPDRPADEPLLAHDLPGQLGGADVQLPGDWVFDVPDRVPELHARFERAGSEFALTRSFGANCARLADGPLAGAVMSSALKITDRHPASRGGICPAVLGWAARAQHRVDRAAVRVA
jgi:hypothetical protein